MSLKSDMICSICKMFLQDPIYLPCHHFICNEHTLGEGNIIKCLELNCNEESLKSKKFKPNETAQKIIKENLHLTEEQKRVRQTIEQMILDFNNLFDEFKSDQSNYEVNIHEHFVEIRRNIDFHREQLKNKIDDISLEMTDLAHKKEKELIQYFRQYYSKILKSDDIDDESKNLLEEFRNPNMMIEQIKSLLKVQEASFNQLKKVMSNFNHQIGKTKQFSFKPNVSIDEKIFGILNLSLIAKQLVSCSADKTIRVWDLETFECIGTLNGHNETIFSLEKVGANQILSCSHDKSIKLWDVNKSLCLKTFNDKSEANCLRLLSKDTFASGSNDGIIKIWNIEDRRCIRILNDHKHSIWDLLLLPNGSLVSCSGDTTIKVWNVDQGVCTKTLNGHTRIVFCLSLLKNGYLASGSADKTIKIWDLETASCITSLIGHSGKIFSLQLRPNGDLISGSGDKKIKIWNLESGSCIKNLEEHTGEILTIKAFQDNYLISGSDDNAIKVWNLETGQCIRTLNDHTDQINSFILI